MNEPMRDKTAERQNVEALRRSRIAHELRGPAGVALGAAAELARKSETQDPFLGMMKRGLERVLRVADRLSRASALERGLVSFNISVEDLRPLIAQEAKRSKDLENKASIDVRVELGDSESTVAFDHEWLAFCIGEVVSNAIQHARKLVSIGLSHDGHRANVTVEDDGPGFREAPDFSFDAPPNSRRGVGLSLAIVHHVIRLGHGGELLVETRDEGGARVTLVLAKERAQGAGR
jgi:signal transduction histidine kinase